MQMYKIEQVHLHVCTFAFPSELYDKYYKLLGEHYDLKNCYIKCIYIYLILQGKTPFYDLKMYM